MHPVILLILLVAVLLFVSWYKRAPKHLRKQIRNRGLVVGLIGLLLIGVLTGRLNVLFALAAAAIPVIYRVLSLLQLVQSARTVGNMFKSARGPSADQSSEIETQYLRMSLDHDSGEMHGEVLAGPYRGRRLAELDLSALLDLLNQCGRTDPQSASLLEAYLDRTHGDAWREQAGAAHQQRPAGPTSQMTREEAGKVLGVSADANAEEVIDAHRRLMQKMHPDRGGSDYIAAQINRAKEVLLEERNS